MDSIDLQWRGRLGRKVTQAHSRERINSDIYKINMVNDGDDFVWMSVTRSTYSPKRTFLLSFYLLYIKA